MGPLSALADLLAPPRCPACGVRAAPPWCESCDRQARRLPASLCCPRCSAPGAEPGDGHACWPADGAVGRSLAVYRYGGPVADAIVGAKVGGLTSVWAPLGRRLADHLARAAVAAGAVVPLPTDPRRRRQRGADHTRVLAGEVAARLALPLVPALTVEPGRLDQGERPLDQRGHVEPGAFLPRGRMAPVAVLLIDDVLTTGGTAQAAAIALRRAGAATVTVGVVARAGRHRLGSGPSRPDDERPTAS